jgi:enoyl-[acyl-carrier-protein] reductase (NADH)
VTTSATKAPISVGLFLAADESRFVTGHVIHVEGGAQFG